MESEKELKKAYKKAVLDVHVVFIASIREKITKIDLTFA